ncbi:MAG TPA: hypothetical protein PLL86_21425 [Leptospiraceae bacterium]|nr:hypothetical protein [Leptospiraceae bacterium]
MNMKLYLSILFLILLFYSCGASNTCRKNCDKDSLACYLIFSDKSIPFGTQLLGLLFCDLNKDNCLSKCSSGSGGSSSGFSRSSSSGSRSSGGGSSGGGGGGSSGGSGGSSHEINSPL